MPQTITCAAAQGRAWDEVLNFGRKEVIKKQMNFYDSHTNQKECFRDSDVRPYMVLMLWRRSASLMSTTRGSSTMPSSITRKLLA